MRTSRLVLLVAGVLSGVTAVCADEGSLVVVFGPESGENARSAARTAADAIRSLKGITVELRRSGPAEPVSIDTRLPGRELERTFLSVAHDSREADAGVFVNTLDAAVQGLALRTGSRRLVAVVHSPPLSGEAEDTLNRVAEFCRANAIGVVLLDVSGSRNPAAPWVKFVELSGGSVADSGRALASALRAPPPPGLEGRPPAPPAPGATEASGLTVFTRFVRTSPRGTLTYGVERHTSAAGAVGSGGLVTSEGGANVEASTGPVRGLFIVQAPLDELKFEANSGQGYLAKVRVTQVARNAAGKAVWTAHKDVTIRGPMSKLDARRAGNLYYLRDVVLPGRRYTLEATVEDLLAGKQGRITEPLRTGDGLPGFYVSDALFVRPFSGSVDRFEADQVFSYDGDALSPLLRPEFRAGEPLNLQVYFVIYPDLYGAQPQMTLEIFQNGRSVGLTKLPFTDSLRDTSREGRGSIQGEQKHQFPYLATLRGAKLPAGDFEARVTVRQGKNVVTRAIPFHVLGDGQSNAETAAGGPAGSASPPVETEPEIVIPDIDPVAIHTAGPSLPAKEAERLWNQAAAEAAGYSGKLPNFRCVQETRRLTAPARNPDQLRVGDVIVDELVYENGHETYHTLEINGLRADKTRKHREGVRSRGEFGTMLKSLFGQEVGASYEWAGRAMAGGVLCQVFNITVAPERSNFVLSHNTRQEVPGYRGKIFIDEESGLVRRLTITGEGLPKDFALQSPSLSLEYGMVRVGEQDYLLPLRSVLQVRQGKTLVRNETVFSRYRKFEATSNIKY